MQLLVKYSLPFVNVIISDKGKAIDVPNVLVDTGSASTMLAADMLTKIDINPSAGDILHTIRGVGGVEVVYLRKVDIIKVGDRTIEDFDLEVGGMDYGFDINGILGMDFLTAAGAIINLKNMRLEFIDY